MRVIGYISVILVLLFGNALGQDSTFIDTVKSAPGITIETEIDRAEIFIGDLINYRLTVYFDSNLILTPPPIGANRLLPEGTLSIMTKPIRCTSLIHTATSWK